MELSPADRRAQERYAAWLDAATRAGFALSAAAFILYATGMLPAFVPLQELPHLWHLPAHRFVAVTGAPVGWSWLGLVGYGDYLCLATLALLAAASAACYARLVPLFARAGEWLDGLLALAQVLVLVVAASGVVSASG